jgi:hypothetical protein
MLFAFFLLVLPIGVFSWFLHEESPSVAENMNEVADLALKRAKLIGCDTNTGMTRGNYDALDLVEVSLRLRPYDVDTLIFAVYLMHSCFIMNERTVRMDGLEHDWWGLIFHAHRIEPENIYLFAPLFFEPVCSSFCMPRVTLERLVVEASEHRASTIICMAIGRFMRENDVANVTINGQVMSMSDVFKFGLQLDKDYVFTMWLIEWGRVGFV